MQINGKKAEKLNFSVLYVEDDEIIREALGRVLSIIVREVHTASDGAKGLAMFKSVHPDFIITDISMPIMDGIEMCQKIRESDAAIPIIITTAHNDTKHFIEAIKSNVTRFILKPIDMDTLQKDINDICRNLYLRREFSKQKKLLDEYKKAVDISNIVSKADKEGNIIYVNDEFCRISGYTREELIGQPHSIVRHPNMPKKAFMHLWETILSKKTWKGIVENRAKDGSSYWVDATIIPILDENDEVSEFIGVRKDITKMITQEQEIERLSACQLKQSVMVASRVNAQSCLQLSPYPAIMVDKDVKIVGANDELLSLFDPLSDGDKLDSIKGGNAIFDELFDIFEAAHEGEDGMRIQWKESLMWLDMSGDSFFASLCDDVLQRRFKMVVRPVGNGENDDFIVFFLK